MEAFTHKWRQENGHTTRCNSYDSMKMDVRVRVPFNTFNEKTLIFIYSQQLMKYLFSTDADVTTISKT